MSRKLTTACLLSAMALTSCSLTDQELNVHWFQDVMTPAQSDSVVVEEGSGLPESAAPAGQPAMQPITIAAAPAPAAQPAAQPVQSPALQPVTAVPQPAQPATAAHRKYTVARGDTLTSIARRFNCSRKDLLGINNLANPNALRIGQVINVPGAVVASQPAPPPAQAVPAAQPVPAPLPQPATAQKKKYPAWQFWRQNAPDTPQAPAPKKKSSWKFWQQNAPATPRKPAPKKKSSWKFWQQDAPNTAPVASHVIYTVRPGDTLSAIARSHGTSISQLMSMNGITLEQANKLRVGQQLILLNKAR